MGLPPNISRDYYDKTMNRVALVFQQGKSVLDSELNQIQKILSEFIRDTTIHTIGNGFLGDSFLVQPSTSNNTIVVTKGVFFWRGKIVFNPTDQTISGLSTPLSNRTDTVYVEFQDLDKDSVDDPALFDPVLARETVHAVERIITIKVQEGGLPQPTVGNPDWFRIGTLQRQAGNPLVTSGLIVDERRRTANNYVTDGLRITKTAGLQYQWTKGIATVGNFDFFIDPSGPSTPPSQANRSFDLASTTGLPNDVLYVSNITGTVGNSITLTHRNPGAPNSPLSVSVAGLDITVNLQTNSFGVIISVLQDIVNAIAASPQASALVTASVITGSNPSAVADQPQPRTALQGGTDGVPGVRFVPANSTVTVYVDGQGNVVNAIVPPNDYIVVLATVTSNATDITSIVDGRTHRPAANRGGLGNPFFAPGGQIDVGGTPGDPNTAQAVSGGGGAKFDFVPEEAMAAFDVISRGVTAGGVRRANATDDSAPCIAIAVSAVTSGRRTEFLTRGEVANPLWNWVPEQPIFLGTNPGQIVQVDPTGVGNISQHLGHAINATTIFFDPDATYLINN